MRVSVRLMFFCPWEFASMNRNANGRRQKIRAAITGRGEGEREWLCCEMEVLSTRACGVKAHIVGVLYAAQHPNANMQFLFFYPRGHVS